MIKDQFEPGQKVVCVDAFGVHWLGGETGLIKGKTYEVHRMDYINGDIYVRVTEFPYKKFLMFRFKKVARPIEEWE